ncbi:MAG: hypothetical protein NC924_04360 [Candidatus Omnitrophica bacterium]|nr:hypothetical protein [Candidatus Omnitrophota bacterium]
MKFKIGWGVFVLALFFSGTCFAREPQKVEVTKNTAAGTIDVAVYYPTKQPRYVYVEMISLKVDDRDKMERRFTVQRGPWQRAQFDVPHLAEAKTIVVTVSPKRGPAWEKSFVLNDIPESNDTSAAAEKKY